MNKPMAVFVSAMWIATSVTADETATFHLEPQFVAQVTETTALGYGNGRKLVSDPSGVMYFSAVSRAPNNMPGVCVIRTDRKSAMVPPTFEKVWIENSNGVAVSASMHFASSLAKQGDGPMYVFWAGGDQTANNDVKSAHQIRFAKISTGAAMKVTDAVQPFTVSGFDQAYRPPYRQSQPWQEFPSAFAAKDGKIHLVWEARDRSHLRPDNYPISAIAYAVRDPNGVWSVQGQIDKPPYLDVKSASDGQYRPFVVVDDSGTVHVLCYGDMYGRLQILHGELINGKFSGWKQIAQSNNDQRHVSTAVDKQGRIHAVWREGGRATEQSYITYSVRELDGKWSGPIRVNQVRYGSTPNITVDDNAAYIVWTGWQEGFENSDGQKNNAFPNDNDTVEGQLEFAYKRFTDENFSTQKLLSGGVGSYPRIARMPSKNGPSKLAVIWTVGKECQSKDCVNIFFGEMAAVPN